MVSESFITKTALACSLCGIVFLFLAQESLVPEKIRLSEITEKHAEKFVETKARIQWIKETENYAMFGLFDEKEILGIRFNPSNEERALLRKASGQKQVITVRGKIQLYRGKLEILVESVKI